MMRHRTNRGALAAVLLALTLSLVLRAPEMAAVADTDGVLYRILSSEPILATDGQEIGREVRCACYSADDHITVLRVVGDAPISPRLDQDSDFDGTLWLVDVGNRGAPQVVVRFHRVAGELTADIYDDQDGDGQVALQGDGRDTTIVESDSWSVRMVALDGCWQRDGRLAPNYDLTVDDRIAATFDSRPFAEAMKNDGQPDVVIRVRGPHGDDPRSYDWRNVYTPFPASSSIYRTTLMVRERGTEPSFPPVFPWYVLGATDGPTTQAETTIANVLRTGFDDGIVKQPGRSFPPVQIDWEIGRIAFIGEFIASRGSDDNWFTYSIKRIEPDTLTNPNFESPFAFYNLADDDDSLPELAVRAVRFDDEAPVADGAPNGSEGLQLVRYSWDQTNEMSWNYKLGLLGRQTVDGRVAFPDFDLQTVPYADLPTWVTEQPWDVVTFVAAERPLWTSEGIYDWDFTRAASDYYIGSAGKPANVEVAFGILGGGLRGDYSFHYQRTPRLTFNPIDRELHLDRAEGGIWNLIDGRQVRFLNLSQGSAIDGWQVLDSGRLISQLYRVPGGLLFSDQEQTLYLRADVPTELFHTAPPTNHAEWVALGEQLASHERAFAPGDLRAMFDQFGDVPVRIAKGPISEFRHADGGIRFVVEASDNATQDVLAALTGSRPQSGAQVVSLVDDRWTLEEGTFASPQFSIEIDDATALRESSVRVAVVNDGSIAIDDALLDVAAVAADGRRFSLLGAAPVAVNGHDEQVLDIEWSPRTPGDWTLEVVLRRAGGNPWSTDPVVLAEATLAFEVQSASPMALGSAARLGWPGVTMGRVIVLLGLVGMTGVIARNGLGRQGWGR